MWLRLVLLIALTFVGAIIFYAYGNGAKEAGIEFHVGTWQEALELAKKDNKLVFLDISASWCGPCKLLKKNTFPDEKVGNFFNAHFINVALDGEKGEGAELVKRYGVRGYPTLLFIDDKGNLIAQSSGYRNASKFLKLGQKVIAQQSGD